MLMARTMWGENNNATPDEYAAIAHVMHNRLQSGDPQYSKGASGQLGSNNSMSRIILAPHQFQAWDDPNAKNYPMNAPLRSPAFQSAYRIASNVLSGQSDDPTHGAVNYYNPKAPGQKTPGWAKGREGQQIGSHKFYGPSAPKDEHPDLMEGAPDAPKKAPVQSASAEGGAPSAGYKPTQDKHADLMEGAPPELQTLSQEEPINVANKQMGAIQGENTLEGIIGASMRDDPVNTRNAILTGTATGLSMVPIGGGVRGLAALAQAYPRLAQTIGIVGGTAATTAGIPQGAKDAFHTLMELVHP